jgi:ABC-2 type transport system permease protein
VSPVAATAGLRRHQTSFTVFRTYTALAGAGFRRYATYRQATAAAVFTNTIFGFLRCYVLLAVVTGRGVGAVAGYDSGRLLTFVWVGQGLIGTVQLWAPPDLADRIRTGEVVSDLLRPIDPVWQLLAADLGRAGFAALTRFVVPLVAGALVFDLYAPKHLVTYPLFALSVGLATVLCFGCRFLVNASAYWLLDARGPNIAWVAASSVLSGLNFPLWFLPRPAVVALFVATPFPALVQLPLDIIVERHPPVQQAGFIGLQATWVLAILGLCRMVQRRAERRLVIQGG